jgi:hypothetical protein
VLISGKVLVDRGLNAKPARGCRVEAVTKRKYLAGLSLVPTERWDQQYADAVAETSYASYGDLSLAYQVVGDGPAETS